MTSVPVTQELSLSSGSPTKTLFPTVHIPKKEWEQRTRQLTYIAILCYASNWHCLHVMHMILGHWLKQSSKGARKLNGIKVYCNSCPFWLHWCFIYMLCYSLHALIACSAILCHGLIFRDNNVKILNPFLIWKVQTKYTISTWQMQLRRTKEVYTHL